jgi:pSer/pThr/pTyr-binding forkhead associated (FHA) protein
MVKCPSCGKRHPENTLFCDECGAYLLSEERKRTDPLAQEDVDWLETDFGTAGAFVNISTRPMTVHLSIQDSGREVEFTLAKEVSIGRLDPATATFPDIDLTTDGALEKGVSRRHAKITRKGAEAFLEDLGSVNGTLLNGKRLTPYLPHVLNDEDEIRVGRLFMRVHIVEVP